MIRDPSDGSVKATCKESLQVQNEAHRYQPMTSGLATSGLPPTSAKAAYLERLEWSRELMREWHRTGTFANMTDAGETCEGAARPVETVEEAQ